ncbi:ankyrin repeat domain-containing protein [Phormidium tenue FACHB-886]|nr:ankyrin repeat domain-containing protein [Phormidium tenue FACHB-886]
MTPVAWAAEKGSCALVHSLIENGAEIDTEDLEGSSPLILVTMGGHFKVVEILLSKGANVQHVTRSGWTALNWARNQLHWKIVEQFKKYAG